MALGRSVETLLSALGYTFRDLSLLGNALTHTSYVNEQKSRGIRHLRSNERLEFLGDAVLQIVISEHLYRSFRDYAEGDLTRIRRSLVCKETLAAVAESMSLGAYLNIGDAEEGAGLRDNPKILANTLESVVGAMYLDCAGDSTYETVILSLFSEHVHTALKPHDDPKTRLQQFIEQNDHVTLEYKIVEESGPAHQRRFTVAVRIDNNEVGRATASTVKEAQMQAAREALRLYGIEV